MVPRDFEFLSTRIGDWKEDLRADVLLLGDAVPQTSRVFRIEPKAIAEGKKQGRGYSSQRSETGTLASR